MLARMRPTLTMAENTTAVRSEATIDAGAVKCALSVSGNCKGLGTYTSRDSRESSVNININVKISIYLIHVLRRKEKVGIVAKMGPKRAGRLLPATRSSM
eukprot:260021-Amorphochlora_amoeboformis.AAC.1